MTPEFIAITVLSVLLAVAVFLWLTSGAAENACLERLLARAERESQLSYSITAVPPELEGAYRLLNRKPVLWTDFLAAALANENWQEHWPRLRRDDLRLKALHAGLVLFVTPGEVPS